MFLLIPIGVNGLASIPNEFVKGDPSTVESTWIGFWGNYLGGFLSSLIGAGVSGFVAYLLIGKEAETNRNAQTLLNFSLKFNDEFQGTKQALIRFMVNLQTCFQYYHMDLIPEVEFYKELHSLLEYAKTLQNDLQGIVNTHALLLQYVREQSSNCNFNTLCEKYNAMVLSCNDIRAAAAKFQKEGKSYDIIENFNLKVIPQANALRQSLVDTEIALVPILFPALETKKNFTLSPLEPITGKDSDSYMRKFRIK